MRSERMKSTALVALAAVLVSAPALAQQPPKPPTPATAPPKAPVPTAPGRSPASMAELRRLGDAFADVAERVSPSVVQIDVSSDAAAITRIVVISNRRYWRGRRVRSTSSSGHSR